MTDSCYAPSRAFCDKTLKRFGIETTYYDPLIGSKIESLFRPNTKAVFCESPGSLTFEVQDVPAIAEVAHARGASVLDRKSTRLNSSHMSISYAVFCLKKKI